MVSVGEDWTLRKAGSSSDTLSQCSVSVNHRDPGLSPPPAHGLCMHGRKGYSLLPILVKNTDNLLFSR